MQTATFISGGRLVETARLLAASFDLIALARCGADSTRTQVHVYLEINHIGEPAATGIIISQLLVTTCQPAPIMLCSPVAVGNKHTPSHN